MYLPHAQSLCDESVDVKLPGRCELLKKTGPYVMADGKYNDAVKIYSTVVRWREAIRQQGGIDVGSL